MLQQSAATIERSKEGKRLEQGKSTVNGTLRGMEGSTKVHA
jgi:hypothetical protein